MIRTDLIKKAPGIVKIPPKAVIKGLKIVHTLMGDNTRIHNPASPPLILRGGIFPS
jgi:hypothetical protein